MLAEFTWVLKAAYDVGHAAIATAIDMLLNRGRRQISLALSHDLPFVLVKFGVQIEIDTVQAG